MEEKDGKEGEDEGLDRNGEKGEDSVGGQS
jgi:hypothetical protein